MSDDNNRVAWPIVEALDAAAVRLKRENADLRAMLREIRRTVIASVRGEEHAATLTDEDVDAHAASTPVDVGNLVARMRSAEVERDAARAIIAGRTTPPTRSEIDELRRQGGRWCCTLPNGGRFYAADPVEFIDRDDCVWDALDTDDRPRSWPVVEAK